MIACLGHVSVVGAHWVGVLFLSRLPTKPRRTLGKRGFVSVSSQRGLVGPQCAMIASLRHRLALAQTASMDGCYCTDHSTKVRSEVVRSYCVILPTLTKPKDSWQFRGFVAVEHLKIRMP
jgi:hypothetical protein